MDELKLNRVSYLINSFRALIETKQDLSAEANQELIFMMSDFLDLLEEQIKNPLDKKAEGEIKC